MSNGVNNPAVLKVDTIFQFVFESLKNHWTILVLATFIAVCVPSYITESLPPFLIFIGSYAIHTILATGYLYLFICIADKGTPELSMLFSKFDKIINYAIANFILMAATVIGCCFFIAPGIYLSARLCVAPMAVLDRQRGPLEAIKYSWHATEGKVTPILSFFTITTIAPVVFVCSMIFIGVLLHMAGVKIGAEKFVMNALIETVTPMICIPMLLGHANIYTTLRDADTPAMAIEPRWDKP